MIGLMEILVGLYLGVTLVLLGAFLMEEMSFKNPDYALAVVAPFFWPCLVGFAALKKWVNYRRENR